MSDKVKPIDPEKLIPLENRVLICVGKIEEKVGSIYVPSTIREKDAHHQIEAEIVSVGAEAFISPATGVKIENCPQKGDKVLTSKYAGVPVYDADKNLYRFVDDRDVIAKVGA